MLIENIKFRATKSYHPTSVNSEITDYLPVDGNSSLASTSVYDVLDRATLITLNDGSETKTAYSLATSPQGNTQYKVSVTDANGTTSHRFTDVRERTLAVVTPDPNGGNITTKYSYDALNQLREVIDNQGNVISSSYDNLGRRTSVMHPDAGLTTLEYDLSGNLLSRQTPNTTTPNPSNGGGSQKIKYFYEFNRLQKITYPYNWQNTVEYHYGEAGAPFNRAGRLVLITDASGGQEFRYDALGNITSQLRSVMIDPARVYAYTSTYEYDSWGRIQQMTYPDGENLSYAYNVAGNLTGIKGEKLGLKQTYIETVGYDEFEQKVYQKLGNGTETTYSYEADRRRLQNMQVTSPFNQTTLINNNYTYDRLSNVLSVQNTATPKPGQLGGSSQNSYQYDILNRLVSATGSFSGIDESANYSLNMQYDDLHNIQNKSVSQTSSINAGSSYNNAYQYSKTPHAPTKVGEDLFSYDANGNQTLHKKANGSFLQYKWDEENRLMASDNFGLVAQYTYDASGERVIKSSAENQKTIFINGAPAGYTYHNDNYTAYVGGHFEVKEGRFTKHYFNGAERLASKIGVGTLDNSAAKGYYQAGGIDYGKRYADAYKDFKQIAKEQGLPPGPPNLKFIYAQQALADQRANSELVANLTLLNNLSLAEWEQQNTDKDPGPPICDDVFCGTGGNIDSGSLPENDIYFFHPDHLGSTSYITNIAGETVQFNTYMPFGESFVSQKRISVVSNYLFNSKEIDPETGLYYYGARYYNSKTSVWLSVDPLALYNPVGEVEHYVDGDHNGGVYNSGNLSSYSYTYQNPIRFIDPNGKQVDVSMFDVNKSPRDKILVTASQNIKQASNSFQVMAHGNPNTMRSVVDGVKIEGERGKINSAEKFDARFKNNIEWQKGKEQKGFNLILYSCNTGKGKTSIAAKLSSSYEKINVIAPTRQLWASTGGKTSVYGKNSDGTKNLNDPGYWLIYQKGKVVDALDATWQPGQSIEGHKVDLSTIPKNHYDGSTAQKDKTKDKN